MPNGVRARGNSRHANRQRNAQRDMAVRAELVQDAPPIVIEAEPISVQADPEIIQQLQRRIAELEEQVKQVKRNYKSAKKQADGGDHIITNMTHYFRNLSQEIGMTTADILSPGWLDNFNREILELNFKAKLTTGALDERNAVGEKYQKAINGTLLAFQETEIQDLKDENDKLMKLNKSLLNIKQRDKGEIESLLKINADMAEDFCKLVDKLGSRKVSLSGINTTTAEVIKKYLLVNGDDMDMDCIVGGEGLWKIEGTGRWRKLINTQDGGEFNLNTKTKKITDSESNWVGQLIEKNGKIDIKYRDEL